MVLDKARNRSAFLVDGVASRLENLDKEKETRILKQVSHELNVDIDQQGDRYLIPIPSFLKNAVVFNDKELKLCNQELKNGSYFILA